MSLRVFESSLKLHSEILSQKDENKPNKNFKRMQFTDDPVVYLGFSCEMCSAVCDLPLPAVAVTSTVNFFSAKLKEKMRRHYITFHASNHKWCITFSPCPLAKIP